MIVTCPGCSSNYRVRNESVPDGGAKMRCPKCQTMFLAVAPPGSEGPPAPEPPSPTTTPEPISGIFDLSTLRAPTPGDDIPFASTRPSGAMPKLAPPQLTSFPPTRIPPAVLPSATVPSPFVQPPTTSSGFAGQGQSPTNPFLSSGAPSPSTASFGPQSTPLSHLGAGPSTGSFPAHTAPQSTPGLSLDDLAASMQGRTPSLQPPYAQAAPSSSFQAAPPTSPFSMATPPVHIAPPASPNAPLPPRHPQGSGVRTSSLVGVLGADLFPGHTLDGPMLPATDPLTTPPRSQPLPSPLKSDAPSTMVDPFAAISSGPDLRSSPGVSRASLQNAALHENSLSDAPRAPSVPPVRALAETPYAARQTSRSVTDGEGTPKVPSAALGALSWVSLLLAVVVVVVGGAFSAWTAGIVDLDPHVLPVLESRFALLPPRSFTGRDDVTVDELLRRANEAKTANDLVGEGVLLKQAAAAAPLDADLQARLSQLLRALGLPPPPVR